MFSFRWFRSAIRNRVAPIPKDTAKIWRDRLSTAYMIIGFNIIGVIIYVSKKNKLELIGDPSMSRVDRFKLLVADNTNLTVIQMEGMNVKSTTEYKADEK